MTARDRLAALLSPELLDALEQLVEERVADVLRERASAPAAEWIPSERAAELLGCSVDAVRMRVKRGRLEGRHQGRRLYVSAESVRTLTGPTCPTSPQ